MKPLFVHLAKPRSFRVKYTITRTDGGRAHALRPPRGNTSERPQVREVHREAVDNVGAEPRVAEDSRLFLYNDQPVKGATGRRHRETANRRGVSQSPPCEPRLRAPSGSGQQPPANGLPGAHMFHCAAFAHVSDANAQSWNAALPGPTSAARARPTYTITTERL